MKTHRSLWLFCFSVLVLLVSDKVYTQERFVPEIMHTTFIDEILSDTHPSALSMFQVTYLRHNIEIPIMRFSGSSSMYRYFPEGIRRWYFSCLRHDTGQKYDMCFYEAQFRELLQLCSDNEICEMQSWHDPEFDQEDSFAYIILREYDVVAAIAYNTRTPESEPFWEVVDYIEDNFVAPALQNPVDKWWWEDYQWQ